MSGIIKSIFLIILILAPQYIFSQNAKIFNQKIINRDANFEKDSVRARNLYISGIKSFQNGFYTQALDTFFESLSVRRKIYGDKNNNLAPAYSGIGIAYGKLGNYDLSLKYFDLAEKSYFLNYERNKRQIINLYVNIGNLYREKLDYSKALQYYEQALNLYKENSEIDPGYIAGYNYPIAEIYYLTDKYDKALEIINANINNSYLEDRIKYYKMLAYIELMQGSNAEAQKSYQNFIDLIILNSGKKSIELAEAYLQYASFLITINKFPEANELLQKADNIIDDTQPSVSLDRSEYFKQMGYYWTFLPVSSANMEIIRKQKSLNLSVANDYFKRALNALNFPGNYSVEKKQELNNLLSLIEAIKILKLIGDNYLDITNIELSNQENILPQSLESTIKTYQIVSSLIQRARRELTSDESKIQLTTLEYSTFYKLIQTANLAYSFTKEKKYIDMAFQSSERVKSSSVYDKISDQMALEKSVVPDSFLKRENKLANTITEYSEKLFKERSKPSPDSSLIIQYNNEMFDASRQREELNQYIENNYSDYYQLKYASSTSTIDDIQNKLKKDQVILEYVMNETDSTCELYTFTIAKENVGFYKQELAPDFIQNIESLFGFVSNDKYLFTTNEDSKKFCSDSYQLYQKLIAPHLNEIHDKNITVIPDGKLSYIPFDALLSSMPDTTKTIEFNRLDYLIKTYKINYSNSANLLFRQKTGAALRNIKVLAFAPKYNDEHFLMGNKEMTLVPLPGVQKEVNKISEIVRTKVFATKDATEKNFRENAKNYEILHLAMHAFINDSLPAFSSLAFDQVKTDDTNSDGLLSTADIYNLKLNAKLTVLSACNTGTGHLQKGEGILSLARGFLYAGCPSIIMSLWEVEDESGTQIMSSFYRNLKKGKTKDEALRAAKLEYLESSGSRKAHPHYWLSFVSIGDNAPLYISYDYYFFILLILAFLGIVIDQIVRIKKARKKQAL